MFQMTDLKTVRCMPTDNGGFIHFSFPILSCEITQPDDEGHYIVTWSNYHKQFGANPGKFAIKRYEYREVVEMYRNRFGKLVRDELWYRKNQHRIEYDLKCIWRREYETVDKFQQEVVRRFSDFGFNILAAFLTHELYERYHCEVL